MVLIFLDTLLNLTHPSRNSSKTARVASTSFTASPRVLPIPLLTDVPKFPSSKPGRGPGALTSFRPRSGSALGRWSDSRAERPLSQGVGSGRTFQLGKGRGLGPRGRLGPRRPPSKGGHGRNSAGGSCGTWLRDVDGDGVRLRGSQTATGQGAGSPPGRVRSLGVSGLGCLVETFPRLISGFGAEAGWPEAGCGECPPGGCGLSLSSPGVGAVAPPTIPWPAASTRWETFSRHQRLWFSNCSPHSPVPLTTPFSLLIGPAPFFWTCRLLFLKLYSYVTSCKIPNRSLLPACFRKSGLSSCGVITYLQLFIYSCGVLTAETVLLYSLP